LARRKDLAAFAVVFTFAALLNAFAMTSPVYTLEQALARLMGVRSEAPVLAVMFVLGLVVAPLLLVGAAAAVSRALARASSSVASTAVRYAYALVPVGLAVWTSHYGFHLLTGALTVVPVAQAAAVDAFGWPLLGAPLWTWAGMKPGSVYPIEVGVVLLGAMVSWTVAQRISVRDHPGRAGRAAAPWVVLTAGIAATALWVLSQPMEMRGTFFG
jgi:hypothetical protein